MIDNKLVDAAINKVLTDWAATFINIRKQAAAQKLGTASGAGLASFDHSVIKAGGGQLARALFLFNTYLRYADLKSKKWDQMPPIEVIEDWMQKKGIEKFKRKYVAKYRRVPPSPEKLLNKIAWGIALKIRQRGHLKKKRVPWFQKGANKGLGVLYGQLGENLSKEVLQGLADSLNNKKL